MYEQLIQVLEKYAMSKEQPESVLRAIQETRDKIHDLQLYEKQTDKYIQELDREIQKWIRRFTTILKGDKIDVNNFVQLFSKLFSLLRIDKKNIYNSGGAFKAMANRGGYLEFSHMDLGEQFFHIMKPREVIHPKGNGLTCRYWAMFLMEFFSRITAGTKGKSKIIGMVGSRHVSNALKIGDTWFIIDVMENPCIADISEPYALRMIDPNLRVFKNRREVLDGTIKDERLQIFDTVEDFIAST